MRERLLCVLSYVRPVSGRLERWDGRLFMAVSGRLPNHGLLATERVLCCESPRCDRRETL